MVNETTCDVDGATRADGKVDQGMLDEILQ